MFVLLGEFTPSKSSSGRAAYLKRHHFGRMWARDKMKFINEHELCGFDNGAWSAYVNNRPFDEDSFLRRLDQARTALANRMRRCIVAAAPDIVAGGLASLEFSLRWREKLPDDLPWHLVVQDGMDEQSVREALPKFRGLFLGGTDAFKTTAEKWCKLAHENGKFFHWGRCRSVNNVREALLIRADSIDSTRPVRAWVSGERHNARAWLNVAMGRDRQRSFLKKSPLMELEK